MILLRKHAVVIEICGNGKLTSDSHNGSVGQESEIVLNYRKRQVLIYSAVSSGLLKALLNFTSLTDLFTQTVRHHLAFSGNCSYTYPPLSIVRYSFIQLSELEQCRLKKT